MSARLIALDRTVLEEMAQARLDEAHALLALLDRFDGDPDCEDATDLEDDHTLTPLALQGAECGPGCAVADQDAASYVEWHTVPANLRRKGQPCILAGQEDDEDDDPREEDGEDAEHDGREAEDGV